MMDRTTRQRRGLALAVVLVVASTVAVAVSVVQDTASPQASAEPVVVAVPAVDAIALPTAVEGEPPRESLSLGGGPRGVGADRSEGKAAAGGESPSREVIARVMHVALDDGGKEQVAPVDGALVECFALPASATSDETALSTDDDPTHGRPIGRWLSRADGTVALALPREAVVLVASHRELGTSGANVVRAAREDDEPIERVLLGLTPQGTLTGVVLDTAREPVAGAEVLFADGSTRRGPRGPRLPMPLHTDERGRFSIRVDAPLRVLMQARLGDTCTVTESAQVQPGALVDVTLHIPGAYSVTCVVVDQDDTPVSGALVSIDGLDRRYWPTMSDDRGLCRLLLVEPARFQIRAHIAGWVQARPAVAVLTTSKPRTTVELHLLRAASITGRVVMADGSVPPPCTVVARPVNTLPDAPTAASAIVREDWETFQRTLDRRAPTDDAGRFRLRGLHPDCPVKVSCQSRVLRTTGDSVLQPGATGVVMVLEER